MIQLYRHYDKDGKLLYVGISKNAGSRFTAHKRNSAWAKHSVRMTTDMYQNRVDASIAELEAIKKEKPLHNRGHLERPSRAPQILERPRRDVPTAMVSARVSILVIEKMNAYCKRTGGSRSLLMERAIKKFLKMA